MSSMLKNSDLFSNFYMDTVYMEAINTYASISLSLFLITCTQKILIHHASHNCEVFNKVFVFTHLSLSCVVLNAEKNKEQNSVSFC